MWRSTVSAAVLMLLTQSIPAAASSPVDAAAYAAEAPLGQAIPGPADSARTLVGLWSGGLEQGGAVILRLGIEVALSPSGEVTATLDSPDQGTSDIPITGLEVRGDSVRFQVASLGGAFRGVLNGERTAMTGVWTQGATSIAMALTRSAEAPSFARPQDPVPPFPYREDGVSYMSRVDGTRLAGTLTLPTGEGPFPAVLLISGSGPQDRNGMLMGHRPFLVLSDHLTRRGIAVLRMDDRGVGGSTGDVMNATLTDRVADTEAGVSFLRTHPEIDPLRVGLVGYSEGGWVAWELAARSEAVAFVVMLAAPAVTPFELLMAQATGMLRGAGEPFLEEQLALTRRTFELIRDEPDDARAAVAVRAAWREWIESLPPEAATTFRARAASDSYQAELERSLQIQTSPWFRGLLAHEPVALDSVRVPVLALFGARDVQVPPAQSVPQLRAAWTAHPDATVHVLPELNHLFQHARTGLPNEYAEIDETFAPQALELIERWITERFGNRAQR